MKFSLEKTDTHGKARVGTIHTDHGDIPTPIFMPVGTVGSVKAVHFQELVEQVSAKIILGNTYHLYLRPGTEVLEAAGGLHRFNGWNRPILTDSGGFQVYSLSHNRKMSEDGVLFRSHIDGLKHFFTPERAIDVQRSIGGDIIMAFDECTPFPCDYNYAKNSLRLTHSWLDRCVKRFRSTTSRYDYSQTLFPIVQGSVYKDLRIQSAEKIASVDCEGNAIGGLAVGEPAEVMYELTELVCDILPKDKPRYLMGVGTPVNILESIAVGVDMMDCVMPTRNGRNGLLFTAQGTMNMKNKKWEMDFTPIDENSPASVDHVYTKAYLHHLFKAQEILAMQIASIHNLAFYLWLVGEARRHIMEGDFMQWKSHMVPVLSRRL